MRMIVFFDLPVDTAENRRNYRNFRKGLIVNGFMMLQESVYCRMVLNQSNLNSVSEAIKKIKPTKGIVQILTVTEKQFSRMEYITGESSSDVIDSDERLIIL